MEKGRKRHSLPYIVPGEKEWREPREEEVGPTPFIFVNHAMPKSKKNSYGLNFKSFPNMQQKSFLERSVRSNNCSLNMPHLSMHSEKNQCNFFEHYCQQNKIYPNKNYHFLNSNFEYNAQNEAEEEKEASKQKGMHSWNISQKFEPSPILKSKRPEDQSFFFGKNNDIFNQESLKKNQVTSGMEMSMNPFLLKPEPIQNKNLRPDPIFLKKRNFESFGIKLQEKPKRNSLILPKRDQFFLSELSISESETKKKKNITCLKASRERGAYSSRWYKPRHSHPNIKFSVSKNADSTIPDISEDMRMAVEVMKKISQLNSTIPSHEKFRIEVNKLLNPFEKNTAS